VPGQAGIDGFEPSGRFQQQGRGVVAPVCPEGEPGPQQIGTSALEFVQRPGLGHAQQPPRRLERARLDLGRSRGQRTSGPPRPVRCQRRRALEECGRGGQAPARLRPAG
jgi:hypothetical protein